MAIRSWRGRWQAWTEAATPAVSRNLGNTLKTNWHMGITAFGGPPVHFKIFHDKFVARLQWIDEQMYQELFSVAQAISGPASTKMLYCINLIHDGSLSAFLGFLFWSLPGFLGMYGLSLGVAQIGATLPRPVYALLSGLNAAVVGIIALAGVQLSEKAITDPVTRLLVFLAAAAGLLYNALWYFPLLLVLAGATTVVHDARWLHAPVKATGRAVFFWRRPRDGVAEAETGSGGAELREGVGHERDGAPSVSGPQTSKRPASPATAGPVPEADDMGNTSSAESEPRVVPAARQIQVSWKLGLVIIAGFLVSFIAVMVLRGTLPEKPLLYRLFANMYLAGTIIFGGGPVVIPLLREYVVAEGWVSPRDFLIGLALIQAFPGPNFNFAVYLGSLTAAGGGYNTLAGAFLGYLGIFLPGMALVHGTMGIWGTIRNRRSVRSALRGMNAAAVGLIYTAVYRIWQIGWIDEGFMQGISLANDPWWVVVTATAYVGGRWFRLNPPVAILLGAVMGLVRYGVVGGR